MVGIIDYGVGNLFSLESSFRAVGAEVFVSSAPQELCKADRLVLPGVGAFADAAEKLRGSGLDGFVKAWVAAGKPLLGICLGMQLLFARSYEYGCHEGLGLLEGQVVPMADRVGDRKVPHMGWNALQNVRGRLLAGMNGQFVYFVHSYYAEGCGASLSATAEYGIHLTAAVEQGNIYGCQFHPEMCLAHSFILKKAARWGCRS